MRVRIHMEKPRLPEAGWRSLWEFYQGIKNKWEPNKNEREIVGIKDPLFLWITDDGVDNSTDDAGNSNLSLSKFDTTSKADSAWIRISNSSGSSKTVRGAAIRGKPVIRLSGEQGIIHDDFVDYEDIYRNGENEFELGNNFIVTRDQTEKLADFHWKNFRAKNHIYIVGMSGTRYWYSPGEWYTLTIDGSGEDIDSVVECYSVEVERGVGELGMTIVAFREVYENWSKDSNAIARIVAGGNPYNMPDFGRRIVASSTYLGKANYFCEGTADETQINAAINELAGIGGGVVELTEGTYYTDGAIVPADNIVIWGKGWQTIIEKNGDYNGIYLAGSGGSEYKNIYLRDFKITRNTSDTNSKYLICLEYCDNSKVDNIWIYNSYDRGAYLGYCDGLSFNNNFCEDNAKAGAYIVYGYYSIIQGNQFDNNTTGLAILTTYSIISGNQCRNNAEKGMSILGADYNTISANECISNGDGDASEGGIILGGSAEGNILSGNFCISNNPDGIEIAGDRNVVTGNRSTSNTTANFDDNGTNTIDSGNDWN